MLWLTNRVQIERQYGSFSHVVEYSSVANAYEQVLEYLDKAFGQSFW